MYQLYKPTPIVINLGGEDGFNLQAKAADYLEQNKNTTGAERGSEKEQGFGVLAEVVVRKSLGLPEVNPNDHPLAYDLLLPLGVKVDVKCRGGKLPFKEEYISSDGLPREAKHNLFARQVYDDRLDTDIYLMTHLETPVDGSLPGTKRQKKWNLYVCGWVSKLRAKREGVFLPRGSLTEQGNKWFNYRGQEIEFYNRNLCGLQNLADLLTVNMNDVKEDQSRRGDLNLTSVDAIRIAYDLAGRGVLSGEQVDFIKEQVGIEQSVKPFLHPNQYFHLLNWLKEAGKANEKDIQKANAIFSEVEYEGI